MGSNVNDNHFFVYKSLCKRQKIHKIAKLHPVKGDENNKDHSTTNKTKTPEQ